MSGEQGIKRGDRCTVNRHTNGNPVRVMAVAEGYAMVRYPRCAPFLEPLSGLSLWSKEQRGE